MMTQKEQVCVHLLTTTFPVARQACIAEIGLAAIAAHFAKGFY